MAYVENVPRNLTEAFDIRRGAIIQFAGRKLLNRKRNVLADGFPGREKLIKADHVHIVREGAEERRSQEAKNVEFTSGLAILRYPAPSLLRFFSPL